MNAHKNARLTFARRLEMVQDITERGLSQGAAALAQGAGRRLQRQPRAVGGNENMSVHGAFEKRRDDERCYAKPAPRWRGTGGGVRE